MEQQCRHWSAVIGLTIRNDRLDSFWFVLLHQSTPGSIFLMQTARSERGDERRERDDDAKRSQKPTGARDITSPSCHLEGRRH
jgi:hypothetical protein